MGVDREQCRAWAGWPWRRLRAAGAPLIALALANWTAKDSRFGGVYNRSLALGNFAHWFVGGLVLLRAQLDTGVPLPLTAALVIYAVFAALFGWLVFGATGLGSHEAGQ